MTFMENGPPSHLAREVIVGVSSQVTCLRNGDKLLDSAIFIVTKLSSFMYLLI